MRTARYLGGWIVDVALTYIVLLCLYIALGIFLPATNGLVYAFLLAACTFGVLPFLRHQTPEAQSRDNGPT